jgi:hypothetical protein
MPSFRNEWASVLASELIFEVNKFGHTLSASKRVYVCERVFAARVAPRDIN